MAGVAEALCGTARFVPVEVGSGRNQLRDGDASVGNGDLGAAGDFGEEGAEAVLGFVDGELYWMLQAS